MKILKRALIVCLLGGGLHAPLLMAHEGHDHDEAVQPVPDSGDRPQRLADGSVFLPKPTQRQLGVRTQPAVLSEAAQTLELSGQVVLDPQRGGRVQAMQAGRLEAGAQGLPLPGMRVKKGQLLARILPAAGQLERSGQAAQLAELKVAQQLAEKRLARLRELADSVPGKEIEALESEIVSVRARAAALTQGLAGSDALFAPVDGVVAAVNGVAGQVVEAGALVFEIADPDSLFVEAHAYEALPVQDIARAYLSPARAADDAAVAVALDFLGAAGRLREQSRPLLFGVRAPGVGRHWPLGQPVKLQVQLTKKTSGVIVSSAALVRTPANLPAVWVKVHAEQFVLKSVRSEALDGAQVLVRDGLAAGDRVVVIGAGLISQIR
ncbi:efflux RND transporter periplasmic adaptor subunit [Azonexus sp.]|uniref:efflux RND transporter periplasmic adaptor subunit n=1 Tax=Azonexus sp. TaxID=1872668 RepID=UPI0039E45E24